MIQPFRSTDSDSEYSNKSSKSIKKKQRKKHAASPDSNYTMIRVGLHNSGLPQRPKPGLNPQDLKMNMFSFVSSG